MWTDFHKFFHQLIRKKIVPVYTTLLKVVLSSVHLLELCEIQLCTCKHDLYAQWSIIKGLHGVVSERSMLGRGKCGLWLLKQLSECMCRLVVLLT